MPPWKNVTVLGDIVISGGGTSEGGEDSVILRNVTAPRMLVDNLGNRFTSVKVEGDGLINQPACVPTPTWRITRRTAAAWRASTWTGRRS